MRWGKPKLRATCSRQLCAFSVIMNSSSFFNFDPVRCMFARVQQCNAMGKPTTGNVNREEELLKKPGYWGEFRTLRLM